MDPRICGLWPFPVSLTQSLPLGVPRAMWRAAPPAFSPSSGGGGDASISSAYFLGLPLSAFPTDLTFGITPQEAVYLRSVFQFSPTSESVICAPRAPLFRSETRKWVTSAAGAGKPWTRALGGKNPPEAERESRVRGRERKPSQRPAACPRAETAGLRGLSLRKARGACGCVQEAAGPCLAPCAPSTASRRQVTQRQAQFSH